MLLNGYYLLTAVLIFYFEVLHSFMWWVTVFPSKGRSKLNYRKTLSVFLKKLRYRGWKTSKSGRHFVLKYFPTFERDFLLSLPKNYFSPLGIKTIVSDYIT